MGCKRLALSPPYTSADLAVLLAPTQHLVNAHTLALFVEPELLITPLFPADVAMGRTVILIAGDQQILDAYHDLVAQRRAPPPRGQTFQLAPEIVIDNVLSTRHTVLEVSGLDRPGLLYDLTTAIGKLNLNIASAHIATFGEKAVDVFYVTDLTHAKITSTARQLTIRKALLEVFEFEGAKAASNRTKVPARA